MCEVLSLTLTAGLLVASVGGENVFAAEVAYVETEMYSALETESRTLYDADDFSYTDLADGTIMITGYEGTDAKVVIPGEIDKKK